MPVAKRFTFAVSVDEDGRLEAEGRDPLEPGEAWTPEHLVLAALGRCTIASLAYHAKRANLDVRAKASAGGLVTKRDEDGRYAFVEIDCELDVTLDPEPSVDALRDLLAKAERDCFVGASLSLPTRYEWRVNGEVVAGVEKPSVTAPTHPA